MTDTERNNRMLDDLFGAATTDPKATPSPELLARVLEDAEALQPQPELLPTRPRVAQAGLWQRLAQTLGGWRPMAGLATTAAVGLLIGFTLVQVVGAQDVTTLVAGDTSYYLAYLDEAYFNLTEGE
ncbi:hypothetical protein [Shimia sp. SDUM112013]|uniref:hypothetical protein n=1 Tax=Shimia sp. SDUM112013 TaxID=3136160 RepID=UPI0032EE0958